MRLTMLGTGNATVTELYNTCFTISEETDKGREHFLIDAGGGNRVLAILKKLDISPGSIHHIFVTHEHVDHILGVIWMIRVIGQKWIKAGKYEGNLHIYCHAQLAEKIKTIASMTIEGKVASLIGDRIRIQVVEDGETLEILGCPVTFFDIHSTKAKQFGFSMITSDGKKLTCLGDEPYSEVEASYVKGSQWLLSEAFCLYGEADKFKPYEKHHSTVREACQLAQEMQIPNLILYHTEETHLPNKKELYTKEGKAFYQGNLYVPDDLESYEL